MARTATGSGQILSERPKNLSAVTKFPSVKTESFYLHVLSFSGPKSSFEGGDS